MFAVQIKTMIGETRSLARLDDLARAVWSALGSGAISEEVAGFLSEAIEDQRRTVRPVDTLAHRAPSVARLAKISIFPPKRRRSPCPDRAASIARRRTLAASGVMPPALASRFTTSELAALRIVADEVRAWKACELTIGAIAARAGCSETIARGAIRMAAALGLVLVIERRRKGQKNDPNLVRIISREWLAWITKRPAPIGFGKPKATDKELIQKKRKNSEAYGLPMKVGRPSSSYGAVSKCFEGAEMA